MIRADAWHRYGEVEYNAETAVNIFVDVIEDQSGKTYKSRQRVFGWLVGANAAFSCSGSLCREIPDVRGRRRARHVRPRA